MKNKNFNISFNAENGTVSEIINPADENKMNWCRPNHSWGEIMLYDIECADTCHEVNVLPLKSFSASETSAESIYESSSVRVKVERFFKNDNVYCERYTLKNLRREDLFLDEGDLSFVLPFNDVYTFAKDCIKNRCHTHIWCGEGVSYVNALRMGESDINLGLFLTEGSLKSYNLNESKTNERGIFSLNCPHIELLSGEEYVLEWDLFWHKGNADFLEKLREYDNFIEIICENYTVFGSEKIEFAVVTKSNNIEVYCANEAVHAVFENGRFNVSYAPKKLGEHKFIIKSGKTATYAEFLVAEPIDDIIKKRINFIVDNQQYNRKGSPLNGAFLIYDTKARHSVFNSIIRDHNACRERFGMALLIIKYLQTHNDAKIRAALDKFMEFLLREAVDVETGEVFDGIGKNPSFLRLYNAPWVTTIFTEMYYLTGNKEYLEYTYRVIKYYYSCGGRDFYPNGLSMYSSCKAFEAAGLTERLCEVRALFTDHAQNMVRKGTAFPKHEVNFEQTIVSPAATFISEMAYLLENDEMKSAAGDHISLLERFSGHQPSYHLYEIPIRFWDDRWFGKTAMFGDVFPHYWSCLTARAYSVFYRLTKLEKYKKGALSCIKNCFCLFFPNGEASCAYVYPFRVNGERAAFYDEWANDQDFALYFYMVINEIL